MTTDPKPYDINVNGEVLKIQRKTDTPEKIKKLIKENQALLSLASIAATILTDGNNNPDFNRTIGLQLKNVIACIFEK